jgi:hypothetical protein
MPPTDVDFLLDIHGSVRAWSDRHAVHKMGWLRQGDVVHVSQEYRGWFKFEIASGGGDLLPTDASYPDYWVKQADLVVQPPTPDPDPEPEPEPDPVDRPSDAQIGAVVRFLFGK